MIPGHPSKMPVAPWAKADMAADSFAPSIGGHAVNKIFCASADRELLPSAGELNRRCISKASPPQSRKLEYVVHPQSELAAQSDAFKTLFGSSNGGSIRQLLEDKQTYDSVAG